MTAPAAAAVVPGTGVVAVDPRTNDAEAPAQRIAVAAADRAQGIVAAVTRELHPNVSARPS